MKSVYYVARGKKDYGWVAGYHVFACDEKPKEELIKELEIWDDIRGPFTKHYAIGLSKKLNWEMSDEKANHNPGRTKRLRENWGI